MVEVGLDHGKQGFDVQSAVLTRFQGTIAGLGAAAVSAFFFPPSLIATGPLLLAAGGTAMYVESLAYRA